MALLPTIPQNKQISITHSQPGGQASGFDQKYVPKNPDGSIFDCTGIVNVSIEYPLPTLANPLAVGAQVCTVGTADATGVVVSLTQAQALALAGALRSPNSQYTMFGVDGGPNTSMIGTGQIQINQTA